MQLNDLSLGIMHTGFKLCTDAHGFTGILCVVLNKIQSLFIRVPLLIQPLEGIDSVTDHVEHHTVSRRQLAMAPPS